LRTTLAELD